MRPHLMSALVGAALVLGACSGQNESRPEAPGQASDSSSDSSSTEVRRAGPPKIDPYEPGTDEEFPNGKRLAGRVAQRALSYSQGVTASDVAASLGPSSVGTAELARVLKPAVDPRRWSAAEVVYPQLSGVTSTSLGAMVVVRQILGAPDRPRRAVTRVLDVRLQRSGGAWSLDTVASVGGSPVRRPARLSPVARRVLDNPRIVLPDSARWDVYRGSIDPTLLAALAGAATDHKLSVAVLRAGHPVNVWETAQPSAHSAGFAADIYAVDGRPVIAQRRPGTAAYDLAEQLSAAGPSQIGSPWVFGYGGSQSFTDAVHQDHIHLQQAPVG